MCPNEQKRMLQLTLVTFHALLVTMTDLFHSAGAQLDPLQPDPRVCINGQWSLAPGLPARA